MATKKFNALMSGMADYLKQGKSDESITDVEKDAAGSDEAFVDFKMDTVVDERMSVPVSESGNNDVAEEEKPAARVRPKRTSAVPRQTASITTTTTASTGKKKCIFTRVTSEFKGKIDEYCLNNDYKLTDLIRECISQAIGYECKEEGLIGNNCLGIKTNVSLPQLNILVTADMKRALKIYAKQKRISENAIVAQAIADKIGYKD